MAIMFIGEQRYIGAVLSILKIQKYKTKNIFNYLAVC